MKKVGILMILLGLLCIMAFAVYKFALEPEIPFLIKLGLLAATIGLIIIIITLIAEKFIKKRKEDEDDLSQY
ncbi:MAG: hypothetical protein ACOZCL_02665 [Bacillota bacterium]